MLRGRRRAPQRRRRLHAGRRGLDPRAARAPPGGGGGGVRPRLLPRPRPPRGPAARVLGPDRPGARGRPAAGDPHPRRGRRDASRCWRREAGDHPVVLHCFSLPERLRRGRPSAATCSASPGPSPSQSLDRSAARRARGPGRAAAGRDRQPLPGARCRAAAGPTGRPTSPTPCASSPPCAASPRRSSTRSPPPTPPASSALSRRPRAAGRRDAQPRRPRHLRPDTDLGQHFLLDENLVDLAIREAGRRPGRRRAGGRRRPRGAHRRRSRAPRRGCTRSSSTGAWSPPSPTRWSGVGNVTVHWGDAMRLPARGPRARRPSALVANLPYYIATPLVLESLWRLPSLERWCVMVQREVVDRWLAPPGGRLYGAPSVLLQLALAPTFRRSVGREVFTPRPARRLRPGRPAPHRAGPRARGARAWCARRSPPGARRWSTRSRSPAPTAPRWRRPSRRSGTRPRSGPRRSRPPRRSRRSPRRCAWTG